MVREDHRTCHDPKRELTMMGFTPKRRRVRQFAHPFLGLARALGMEPRFVMSRPAYAKVMKSSILPGEIAT